MRPHLQESKVHGTALKTIESFHTNIITELEQAIAQNEWVIVGMATNPFCKKARTLLTSKGTTFKYIEYGSYFSMWKERLAIKLWSGWPTFPQVFHKGILIGGFQDLEKYLAL